MRFQKRIQILPWVRLNISGSGFSFSFGPPGLSVNAGKKGVKVTAGIPGSGLSTTHSISEPGAARGATLPTKDLDQLLKEIEVETAPIEALLRELNFSEWMKQHLDAECVAADPMYSRAVVVALVNKNLDQKFLAFYLNIDLTRAGFLVKMMGFDGIRPVHPGSAEPESQIDIGAMKLAFDRSEA